VSWVARDGGGGGRKLEVLVEKDKAPELAVVTVAFYLSADEAPKRIPCKRTQKQRGANGTQRSAGEYCISRSQSDPTNQ